MPENTEPTPGSSEWDRTHPAPGFESPGFPKPPPVDWNKLTDTVNDLKDTVTDNLNNPPNPDLVKVKSFYQRNKPLILTGVGCIVLYKIEKRMVKKVVTKVVRSDTAIIKHHLNQLTMATEDLAQMAHDKRFGVDTFLRGVTDGVNNAR